jgi:hypothetical protein
MGQIVDPKTLVFNLNKTPGNYPKEDNLNKGVNKFPKYFHQSSLRASFFMYVTAHI